MKTITIYVSDTDVYLSPPVEGIEVDRSDLFGTMQELMSMGYDVELARVNANKEEAS
jgi:hypothetical protein